MLTLPRKYTDVCKLARKLGCSKLIIREEGDHFSLDITCPSHYVSNRLREKVKEITLNKNSDDLTLNLKVHFKTVDTSIRCRKRYGPMGLC